MSDFTTDAPILRRSGTASRREFYVYFALIFAATLPLCLLMWALKAARRMEIPEKGPVASAWTQARIITPHIFTA
ncbi:PufQ cytochrome subunit [Loktanella fryxellensis]|uniref:PufQ cytochrome subunit n=1 Tax=Loktanella fryxellensis TaxID=245187 RepID=A0A1H7ZZT6_9RHOB|nr:cytochrome PufQ [Loktanella fryxellensis]SEM62837.1 PufQ cytochrome subunit [Loktanella fryxellensis]